MKTIKIIGTVVNVREIERNYAKKPGTFKVMEIAYRKESGDIKFTSLVMSFLEKKPDLLGKIKALKVDEKIVLVMEESGQFFTLVDIEAYVVGQTKSTNPSSEGITPKFNDFNTRAARGQALNLAVAVAIADKKHHDDNFIKLQVARFLRMGQMVQDDDMPLKIIAKEDENDDLPEITESLENVPF